MSKINRREMLAAGAGLVPVVGLAAAAAAQDPFTPPVHAPKAGSGTYTDGGNVRNTEPVLDSEDPVLAACLLIKGHKQIQVCTRALTRINDPEVKAFAQAEIDEHETLKKKLQQLGYQFPTTPASGADALNPANSAVVSDSDPKGTRPAPTTVVRTPATNSPAAPGTTQGGNEAGGIANGGVTNASTTTNPVRAGNTDQARRPGRSLAVGRTMLPRAAALIVGMETEIGEQCIATSNTESEKFSGKEYDKWFVGTQIGAHYDLFDHGVVFRKHSSAEMAPVLDEARTIIEKHIATCKKLMAKLDASKD